MSMSNLPVAIIQGNRIYRIYNWERDALSMQRIALFVGRSFPLLRPEHAHILIIMKNLGNSAIFRKLFD